MNEAAFNRRGSWTAFLPTHFISSVNHRSLCWLVSASASELWIWLDDATRYLRSIARTHSKFQMANTCYRDRDIDQCSLSLNSEKRYKIGHGLTDNVCVVRVPRPNSPCILIYTSIISYHSFIYMLYMQYSVALASATSSSSLCSPKFYQTMKSIAINSHISRPINFYDFKIPTSTYYICDYVTLIELGLGIR